MDRLEPTLLYVVKQVELSIRAQLDALLRPLGMKTLQYTALTVLERHPELTSTQLARSSFVSQQTMAELVSELLARGLVQRRRDAADRRRLILALTPAGQQILRSCRDDVAAIEDRMLAGLSADEVGVARRLVDRFRVNLANG